MPAASDENIGDFHSRIFGTKRRPAPATKPAGLRRIAPAVVLRLAPFRFRHEPAVDEQPNLNVKDVRRRFDRAAGSFDAAAFVHAATREGLLARLQPLVVEATAVLDLGSATGKASPLLRKRFGRAHLVSLDISLNMLRQGRRKRSWFARSSFVQANAVRLPFADQCFDVVFSNQLLPWIDSPGAVFDEIARVLRKGGVFAFATLGPDSLLEIGRAWRDIDEHAHVMRFPDMHDLGDALVSAGLRDPVLDVDCLNVRYRHYRDLFADLTNSGGRNALLGRNRAMVGKQRFARMTSALQGDGEIDLDLELVYGHCWGGGAKPDPMHYTIDAGRIPLRRG